MWDICNFLCEWFSSSFSLLFVRSPPLPSLVHLDFKGIFYNFWGLLKQLHAVTIHATNISQALGSSLRDWVGGKTAFSIVVIVSVVLHEASCNTERSWATYLRAILTSYFRLRYNLANKKTNTKEANTRKRKNNAPLIARQTVTDKQEQKKQLL